MQTGISDYDIYRATLPNPTTLLGNVGMVTCYQDITGSENSTYYYRVKAIKGSGLCSTGYCNRKGQPWWPGSNKRIFGEPGAIQFAAAI